MLPERLRLAFERGYARGRQLAEEEDRRADPFAADPYGLGVLLALVQRIVLNSADLTHQQNIQLSNALLDAENIIRARIS